MRYLVTIIWFFIFACRLPPSGLGADPARRPDVKLTVVATGDFHGALEARKDKAAGGRKVGGIDIIAAYLQAIRDDNPAGTILLDAGDLYQGTLLSAATEGHEIIRFFNDMGYDAAVVGNHDFDFGPVGYHSTPVNPDDDPLGVIKARISEADFPFLAANIFDRKTKKPVGWKNLHDYTIVTRRGIKIGIIGLTSMDTPLITNPANVASLEFKPLLSTLRRVLPRVRKEGATLIIVIGHVGIWRDKSSGNICGPIAELARSLSPGEVDLIVSGHRHTPFSATVNGIPIVQTWAKGASFARVDLFVKRESKRVTPGSVEVSPVNFFYRSEKDGSPPEFLGKKIVPSGRFVKELDRIKRTVDHLERIRLGRASKTLRNQLALDSPVGNLVTDAMRATDSSIDVAMYNSGGLRTSINKGIITYGRIYEVVPFDNNIVIVSLTGKQITEIIEHGLSSLYGVMEISGLEVTVDPDATPGRRCVAIRFSDGRPLDPEKLYTVATNDFVLSGGDGYYAFAKGENIRNTHTLIREVVARYIKEKGVVVPHEKKRYRPCKKKGDKDSK